MYLEIRDPTVYFFVRIFGISIELNSELEFDARVVENCLDTPSHPTGPYFAKILKLFQLTRLFHLDFDFASLHWDIMLMGFIMIWNLILEIDFTPFNSNLIYLILRLALGYHVVV